MNLTTHKILDVAERYTQTSGFNAFSYRDIQNEVGVKTSSIHYYFSTKQDLALALIERYVDRFSEVINNIALTESDGLQRLHKLSELHVKLVEDGKFCMCGMMASDMLSFPKNVTTALAKFFEMTQLWIEEALQLAKNSGQIREKTDIKKASMAFLSSLEGGMLIARVQNTPQYLKQVSEGFLSQIT